MFRDISQESESWPEDGKDAQFDESEYSKSNPKTKPAGHIGRLGTFPFWSRTSMF
jgi:hypothetical protein